MVSLVNASPKDVIAERSADRSYRNQNTKDSHYENCNYSSVAACRKNCDPNMCKLRCRHI